MVNVDDGSEGVRLDVWLDIACVFKTRSVELLPSKVEGVTVEQDNPGTYELAGRAMWQWQPNVVVVPVFKWYSYDLSTVDPVAGTDDNSLTGWQLGAAGNWTLAVLLALTLFGFYASRAGQPLFGTILKD